MSYRGSAYRGPADRSRSPPRFGGDRRPSAASIFDTRHSGPPRSASDAPRGPRSQSQFDGPLARGPPPSGLNSGGAPRNLRDAPPLGTGDRARPPYRERDYPDRRERSPPLRERSPPRKFNDSRDFPRDVDARSTRRGSRDGPLSAGSNYSDNPPFPPSSNFRGNGFSRGRGGGRGGGDYFDRGSFRGGRRSIDDRADLIRRDRSPPPRFGRDLSRDGREPDRRDDRRFERREDDRRPEWLDREREPRRDLPPGRLETRASTDSLSTANPAYQSAQPPPINPERLAIIENSGADPIVRRASSAQIVSPTTRREPPSETPAHLIARADSTAHRYGSRGSSPPTQAPPVPAFSFSVTSTSAPSQSVQATRPISDAHSVLTANDYAVEDPKASTEDKPAPPLDAPTAPRALPAVRTHHTSPPPMAPKAPRALELDSSVPPTNRLQGVRSLENLSGTGQSPGSDPSMTQPTTMPPSPRTARQFLPHLAQPFSPNPSTLPRVTDLAAPTGPRASRMSPALSATSPRPSFTSPRSDTGVFQGSSVNFQKGQTPPSGPRKHSFSVSPKIASSSVPTAPRADRAAPMAPRVNERIAAPQHRPQDRPNGMPPYAPSGPRSHVQWNQWRRPGAPIYGEKPGTAIPVKRDYNGIEKENIDRFHSPSTEHHGVVHNNNRVKQEDQDSHQPVVTESRPTSSDRNEDQMGEDSHSTRRRSTLTEGHSAAQSFFGKTLEKSEDEIASSSDEDELDEEEDATLLEAKHARKERELRSKLYNLSGRDYRGTSPLESIARLFRLTERDIERSNALRDDEMDLDQARTEPKRLMPPIMQSSESEDAPDILTPQCEDANTVVFREQEDGLRRPRHVRRRSPEPVPLPFLLKGQEISPLQDSDVFQDNIKALEETESDVLAEIERVVQAKEGWEEEAKTKFDDLFKTWRQDCEDLDREREEQERLERQQSAEPGPELETPAVIPAYPILEGRRLHKFSSEYAFEQALKQSEETARIEQENAEREAKKNQADMEKEAKLPDQLSREAIIPSMYRDTNRRREPQSLTIVFSYEPPADDFTEHEQQIFIAAFKETPKKWGEIASLLPNRTYQDCIHHYYANKWDGRFRDNKAKKFKGRGRGRGGKARPSRGSALMADLNRGEDITPTNDSNTGRPKRAAAPTTFGEKEIEAKGTLVGQSPLKKPTASKDGNGDGTERKRRKTEGSKPGRKSKAQPTVIAAAPSMSPNKLVIPGGHTKEEVRAQSLEDASLLANLQGGHQSISHPDAHFPLNQEGFLIQRALADDPDRPKPQPSGRPGASSYWSVPEQTDFFKYIAHFGTDFGAIASHMGTKTQTMIKNHYQRQIDGGRADLEESANKANARRQRGEDIGPPPTPTPIVKRRYDNPQSSTPRPIAPQADPTTVEEPAPLAPQPTSKHTSPPQPQPKPRYQTPAQNTPVPPRVVPSPLAVTSTPMAVTPSSAAPPPSRGLGHPLGRRYHLLDETRAESHPIIQSSPGFGMQQEEPTFPRSQPPQPLSQPARTPSHSLDHAPDAQLLHNLRQEQERAMRIQSIHGPELRNEQTHGRHDPIQVPRTHGSPANQPLSGPAAERKQIVEEGIPTPPRGSLFAPGPSRLSMFSTSAVPLSSLTARGPYNPSPPKQDISRQGSVSTPATIQPTPSQTPAPVSAPAPTVTPAPEPPKRFDLVSILNSDPEEPKPASKRESFPPAPTRNASPASSSYPATSVTQSISNTTQPRRETFAQPSLHGSQAHFHRTSYGHGPSTKTPPTPLRHEPPAVVGPQQQTATNEWTSRVYPSPATNPMSREREAPRFFPPNQGMLGGLSHQARVNPSPPPHTLHSRTPSLTAQQALPSARDQRSMLGGPPQGNPHQPGQVAHSNQYGGSQQLPSYSHAPSLSQNRSHHSHNSSITEGGMLSRFGPREELLRSEDDAARAARKREEHDPFRARVEALHAEKNRDPRDIRDPRDHYLTQREQETERQRQQQRHQTYSRGPLPPQPVQPGPQYDPSFSQHRMGYGLREQSARDTEFMIQQERNLHEENERRQREAHYQHMPHIRDREPPVDALRRQEPYGGVPYPHLPGRR